MGFTSTFRYRPAMCRNSLPCSHGEREGIWRAFADVIFAWKKIFSSKQTAVISYLSDVERGITIRPCLAGVSVLRTANLVSVLRTTLSRVWQTTQTWKRFLLQNTTVGESRSWPIVIDARWKRKAALTQVITTTTSCSTGSAYCEHSC